MCLSLRWDGLDGCVKSLLHVYFHTRADATPSSVSSLSAGPAHASVHFSHDHFHTWFSITIVPRNLRNNTKMQPLKAEAYVVQNIYRTHNNKLLTGGDPVEVWSKTTNNSRRQRSNEQTTTPRCAGTRRSRGRERWEGKAQNKEKWRLGHSFQQEHQREEQLSFHFINLNLPTMLRFCRNSMHACMNVRFWHLQANVFHIPKVTRTTHPRLALSCPSCGISSAQPRPSSTFLPSTLRSGLQRLGTRVWQHVRNCRGASWHLRVCSSASFLLRRDPSVQLGNGENKRYGVWTASGPEDTGGGMWHGLLSPADVCVCVLMLLGRRGRGGDSAALNVTVTWCLSLNNLLEWKQKKKKNRFETLPAPQEHFRLASRTKSSEVMSLGPRDNNKNKYWINAKISVQQSFFIAEGVSGWSLPGHRTRWILIFSLYADRLHFIRGKVFADVDAEGHKWKYQTQTHLSQPMLLSFTMLVPLL